MATTKIWDGITWRDLQGPQGPAGPTVVSADSVNFCKLGTDGKILVAQADLDARYVNVTGDTMTGPLAVTAGSVMTAPPSAIHPSTALHVARSGGTAIVEVYTAAATGAIPAVYFRRKGGTLAAPAPIASGQQMGAVRWVTKPNNGAADRTTAQINVATSSVESDDGYFDGTMGMTLTGAKAGNPSASIIFQCTVASGRVITTTCDTFVVAGTNFSVDANGRIASLDGIAVDRTRAGVGGEFFVDNVNDGETAYGAYAKCTGTAATVTAGGITGVRGEVTGNVWNAVGVAGIATSTGGTNYGLQAQSSGANRNIGLWVNTGTVKRAGDFAVQSVSPDDVYLKGFVGLNWSTPSNQLEVGGSTMLRGTLDVVGNITSTGAAHSFASASIPSSAVIGSAAFTPATSAAAGAAGSMRWDENYLYVRTATAWKRIALTAF